MADLKNLSKKIQEYERRKEEANSGVLNPNDPTENVVPSRRIPFSYQATIQRNSRGDMIGARIDPILDE